MMNPFCRRSVRFGLLISGVVLSCAPLCTQAGAQVFVVGEKSALDSVSTEFKATHVELPDGQLNERERRELVRDLDDELGFAHRVLPTGAILTLQANGNMTPTGDQYKDMLYKKGSFAAPGDRVAITALEFKGDRLVIDLNGGPYPPHRFTRHIQIGIGGAMTQNPDLDERASGCRIILVFEGRIPDLAAPQVKALLEPLVDFKVKTGEQAYADTLPVPIRDAIKSHDVLVGMNRRMVLAALGQPETKMRENGYEEWIYGHQPQTMHFVRFQSDRVSRVEVAALGKPLEIRDQDEMAGYMPPLQTVAVGDVPQKDGAAAVPPTLKLPDEKQTPTVNPAEGTSMRKVQMPIPREPGTEQEPTAAPPKAVGAPPDMTPPSSGPAPPPA